MRQGNIVAMFVDDVDNEAEKLDDRKAAILYAVVQRYICTARPVGSARISDSPGVEVSSATVRSEMASLEDRRYLMQPHTSAGRVPTTKGYRFFVDLVRDRAPSLEPSDNRQVSEFFESSHGDTSEILSQTTGLLSELTDWTGVVVGPSPAMAIVRSAQLIEIATRRVLVVAVMSNGTVEKRLLDVAAGTTSRVIADASQRLAQRVVGKTLAEVEDCHDSDDPLLVAAIAALREAIEHHEVFVGGTAKLAAAFDVVDQLRKVLSLLEQQFVMVSLMREVISRGNRVAIGAETGVPSLAGCSLVLAPYSADGAETGAVGVLGPTRMDYLRALSAVTVVSEQLSATLTMTSD